MHTHMLFSRSYTLLCALETAHTPYTIYFALIHHCTNSLSSLHIFVHHCTFCASLHTKTSPVYCIVLYCIVLYCIVFIHFYSASHSMSLSVALPTTVITLCRIVYTPKSYRQFSCE